jgi:hypothetical protein
MILAMPITVCLVVLGKHVPNLEWLHILLGNDPVFQPSVRLYQRLLACELDQAEQVLRSAEGELSREQIYETIILPALMQLHRDAQSGLLAPGCIQNTRQMLGTYVHDKESANPQPSSQPPRKLDCVIVLDRGPFDELIPAMIAMIANVHIPDAQILSARSLSAEVVSHVSNTRPAAVLLAAIEPRDATRMRHIWRRLRAATGTGNVVSAVFCLTSDVRKSAWNNDVLVNPGLRKLFTDISNMISRASSRDEAQVAIAPISAVPMNASRAG